MCTRLLKLDEAAELLACSRRQINRYVQTGQLRAVRVAENTTWRIPAAAIDEFVGSMQTNEPKYRSPKLRAVQ